MHDRLEFALRKVDLARWKYKRVKHKLLLQANGRVEEPCHDLEYFILRLRSGLHKLGVPEKKVEYVITICQSRQLQQGTRVPVNYKTANTVSTQLALDSIGLPWTESEVRSKSNYGYMR